MHPLWTVLKILQQHQLAHARHDDAHESLSPARLERTFIYCAAWGLGGLLDVKDRAAFDAELRIFAANMPPRCAPCVPTAQAPVLALGSSLVNPC